MVLFSMLIFSTLNKTEVTAMRCANALGPMLGVVLNGMHLWPSNMTGFAIGVLWGPIFTVLFTKDRS